LVYFEDFVVWSIGPESHLCPAGAFELAVAPDAAQQRFTGHPVRLRRAGEPGRYAASRGAKR
jgi:hypothetical protein